MSSSFFARRAAQAANWCCQRSFLAAGRSFAGIVDSAEQWLSTCPIANSLGTELQLAAGELLIKHPCHLSQAELLFFLEETFSHSHAGVGLTCPPSRTWTSTHPSVYMCTKKQIKTIIAHIKTNHHKPYQNHHNPYLKLCQNHQKPYQKTMSKPP